MIREGKGNDLELLLGKDFLKECCMSIDFEKSAVKIRNLVDWTKVDETTAGHLRIPLLHFASSGWHAPPQADSDWKVVALGRLPRLVNTNGTNHFPSRFEHRRRARADRD